MVDFGGQCEFSLKIHLSTGASGWFYVHSSISFIYIYFSCGFFSSLFVSFDLKIIEMMLYSLIESQALNIGYGHGNRIEVRYVLRDYDARIQMMIWTQRHVYKHTTHTHTHSYIESMNERVLDRTATCTHFGHLNGLHCTRAMHFKVHMCIHCTHNTLTRNVCWTAAQDISITIQYVYTMIARKMMMRACARAARYAVFHGAMTLSAFQLNIKFKTRNTSIYEYYIIKCDSLVTLSNILSSRIGISCVCCCMLYGRTAQTRVLLTSLSFVIWKFNSFVVIATHAYTLYTLTHTNMHGHRHRHTAYVHTYRLFCFGTGHISAILMTRTLAGRKISKNNNEKKNTSLNLSQMTFGSSNMGSFFMAFST